MNKRLTAEQLEAIRQRVDSLVSEEWYFDGEIYERKYGNPVINANNHGDLIISEVVGQFIANSRSDIPALLAEVERLNSHLSEIIGAIYEHISEGHALMELAERIDSE